MSTNSHITTQWLIENGIITPQLYEKRGWLVFYYAIMSQAEQKRKHSTRRLFQDAIDPEVTGKAKTEKQTARMSLLIIPLPAEFSNKETLVATSKPMTSELSGHIHRKEEKALIGTQTSYLKVFLKRTKEGAAFLVFRFNFFNANNVQLLTEIEEPTNNPANQFLEIVEALDLVKTLQES